MIEIKQLNVNDVNSQICIFFALNDENFVQFMAPTPSSASGELWGHHWMPEEVCLDILMPNGIYIALLAGRDSTLEAIKEDAWREAKRFFLLIIFNYFQKRNFFYIDCHYFRCCNCHRLMFLRVLFMMESLKNFSMKADVFVIYCYFCLSFNLPNP